MIDIAANQRQRRRNRSVIQLEIRSMNSSIKILSYPLGFSIRWRQKSLPVNGGVEILPYSFAKVLLQANSPPFSA
jgi:hypothetical protein